MSLARREIGALPPHAKADAGKRVNEARAAIQAAYDARLGRAGGASGPQRVLVEERVDVTLPWDRRPRGARHPLTTLMERIGDLFVGMGYEVAEGPEVELEWANFDALNIAADHPARGADGHVLRRRRRAGPRESGLVLRTHTSPVQARTMLTRTPPIYVVCPGRVYRTDELDATHTPGLPPGRGPGRRQGHHDGAPEGHAGPLRPGHVRRRRRRPGWRPHYFPFTEPSAEFDVWFPQHRDGPRWVEWGGCGMVNPRVLRACGIDPEVYSGFAFGMGIERTLMFRHGVTRHARHGRGRRAVHPRVRHGGA